VREPGAASLDTDPENEEENSLIDATEVATQLERVKWFLWHGNVPRALEGVASINGLLCTLSPGPIYSDPRESAEP
jgi:hypothetical protein